MRERKGIDPIGWQIFARGLAKMNAPEDLVRNERRRGTLREFKSRLGEQEDVWLPSTPPTNPPLVQTSKRLNHQPSSRPPSDKTPVSMRPRQLPKRWLPFNS